MVQSSGWVLKGPVWGAFCTFYAFPPPLLRSRSNWSLSLFMMDHPGIVILECAWQGEVCLSKHLQWWLFVSRKQPLMDFEAKTLSSEHQDSIKLNYLHWLILICGQLSKSDDDGNKYVWWRRKKRTWRSICPPILLPRWNHMNKSSKVRWKILCFFCRA